MFGWPDWWTSGFSDNLALFKCFILSYSLSLLVEPNKYLLQASLGKARLPKYFMVYFELKFSSLVIVVLKGIFCDLIQSSNAVRATNGEGQTIYGAQIYRVIQAVSHRFFALISISYMGRFSVNILLLANQTLR